MEVAAIPGYEAVRIEASTITELRNSEFRLYDTLLGLEPSFPRIRG